MISVFKELSHYLLSPSDGVVDSVEFRRHIFVKLILGSATTILFVFSFLHFFTSDSRQTLIATIDFIAALATLYGMVDLKRTQNINRASLIATLSLFVFFISFALVNQNESFGLIWLIFFPIIAITINRKVTGLVFAGLFLVIIYGMAFWGIGEWQNGQWDFESFLRLSIALALIIVVMYVHEAAMFKAQAFELRTLKLLEERALVDELTQLANRRRINELLNSEIKRNKRYHSTFSIVIFDIDHFKIVNDTYGHLVGDDVLKGLANVATNLTRETETVGRWGGEEFVIILPQIDAKQAAIVAEKLRIAISKTAFETIEKTITCSFGVAEYIENESLERLIERADCALYDAKESGRNQVSVCNLNKLN